MFSSPRFLDARKTRLAAMLGGRHRYASTLAAICIAVVILGSLLPSWKSLFHVPGLFHLPAHVAAFALCAFLVFSVILPRWHLVACTALAGLAITLEVAEYLIYRYRFEWRDCVADLFGLLVILLFFGGDRQTGQTARSFHAE